MSVDEFGEQSPIVQNNFPEAVKHFDQVQEELFGTIETCLRNPSKQGFSTLTEITESSRLGFRDVITAIATDEELDIEERSNAMSTWYFDTEKKRLDFFRELAPDGDYEPEEFTREQMAENVQDYFDSGLEVEEIAMDITNGYIRGFAVDLSDLLDVAEPSRRAKAVFLAKDIGEQALEIGKISAGVIIGGILLRKAFKIR